jgi:chromosome segregation ATPase
MDLKEDLLKSSKEQVSRNAKDIASLQQNLSWVEEELAGEKKKNVSLDAENLKLKDEISHLKAKADSNNSAIIALRSELQGTATKLQKTQVEL